jgi:hypothetical protein
VLPRLIARLPPLWATVALLVGLTLPQSLLALPVAAASVGVVPALVVLAVGGTLMAFGSVAEAEAVARDGDFRRQGGFFGKFVERYLGARAASVPTALAGARTGISVLGGYVGISVTLDELTGLPRQVWGALTIVALATLLVRGGIRIPAALGASMGLACLPLLVAIAVVAIAHGDTGNLEGVDALSGEALGGFVGLTLILYMSNVYMVDVARETLPFDPDGRALIAGTAIATAIVTAIAAGWLVATAAALDPGRLAGEVGTVLGPLARETGTAVKVLGGLLTLLLLGLGIERAAVAVMNLVAERLSGPRALPVLVPLAICLIGEGLLEANSVSFAGVFNAAGIAANVVLGLALPFLLIAASRRSGDVTPGLTVPLAGRRGVAAAMFVADAALLVALATVLGHGVMLRVVALGALGALAAFLWLARPAYRLPGSEAPGR